MTSLNIDRISSNICLRIDKKWTILMARKPSPHSFFKNWIEVVLFILSHNSTGSYIVGIDQNAACFWLSYVETYRDIVLSKSSKDICMLSIRLFYILHVTSWLLKRKFNHVDTSRFTFTIEIVENMSFIWSGTDLCHSLVTY